MRLKHLKYYLTIISAFVLLSLFSQGEEISGVINDYARVDSIFCLNNNDIDTVKVSEIPDGLKVGDIVMIHHIKGASIDSDPPDGEGDHKDGLDKSGIYSIFKVEGILSGPKYIILNYSFQFSSFYRNGSNPIAFSICNWLLWLFSAVFI